MKALVYHGPRDLRYEDVPDAGIESPGDALVRVTRTAICGSDLHLWRGLPLPERGFAVGHELVGVVEAVGSEVEGVAAGDRVLVSCTLGCGRCPACRRGLHSSCPVVTAGGTRIGVLGFSSAFPGAQAEAVRVPFADANVFRIPDAIGDEQAVFVTDTLPTADMACEMAEVGPGDTVAVLGSGPVGALVQRCAGQRGARRVIAIDPDPGRREQAVARGCEGIDPDTEDPGERVRELTGGRGADAVIEAVGRPELVALATELAAPGGRIAVAGVIVAPVTLPWASFFGKQLTLRSGLVSPQRRVAELLALLEDGRLDPAELVTHRMPLARGPEAYELCSEHGEDVLKLLLAP